MKKYIAPVFIALLVGFFSAQFMFNQYDDKETLTPVFNNGENLYFIQQGVYSTIESLKDNMKDFNNYIYTIINAKYYAFIGITKNQENAQKIQDYYKQLGYITYIKEFKVGNSTFLKSLSNYDNVLENTNDDNTIKTLINQVLTKYKELVVDG
ncbi:MAG: hypothetical protein RR404_02895 [Bacilli bacterium]